MGRFGLRISSLLLLVLDIKLACTQQSTSLYIPGFDPQPVSADVLGVGLGGSTTWALHKGQRAATDTSSYPDFIGTATLVEGSNGAFLTYANDKASFTIGHSCTFSEGTLAICTIVAQGSTATQTEIITRLAIQGGGPSAVPATITTPPSSTSPIPTLSDSILSYTGVYPTNPPPSNSALRQGLSSRHALLAVTSFLLIHTIPLLRVFTLMD